MIPFNRTSLLGNEQKYINDALASQALHNKARYYTKACQLLKQLSHCSHILLTPSCTSALELSALLIDIAPGDEVILPSFTYSATANAFILRGAKLVFIDICPHTMNINSNNIVSAITPKTKAIIAVHYAGISCDLAQLKKISTDHKLLLIEDAAQALGSTFEGKPVGSIGDLACYSFHSTKNITSGGEGGALLINNPNLIKKAEVLSNNGTNKEAFLRNEVDHYTWVEKGINANLSELQCAYLLAQLEHIEGITKARRELWYRYYEALLPLTQIKSLSLCSEPSYTQQHNAHLFFIKLADRSQRDSFIQHMNKHNIACHFHYIPLHTSPAGITHGKFHQEDVITTEHSSSLVRLPLYPDLTLKEQHTVIKHVKSFFKK